jgi:hypothetical protein
MGERQTGAVRSIDDKALFPAHHIMADNDDGMTARGGGVLTVSQ